MVRKIITLICLTFTLSTHAASISYYGYTLDTETNIVTGGGLRWLQWDETTGQSVTQALATHGSSGWRLATSSEMATLFNAFDFRITFEGDDSITQTVSFLEPYQSEGVADRFIQLFGASISPPPEYTCPYCSQVPVSYYNTTPEFEFQPRSNFLFSLALYGSDQNGDGIYSRAEVFEDTSSTEPLLGYNPEDPEDKITAAMYGELSIANFFTFPYFSPPSGVALVQEVPVPASAWLFISALLGLFGKHYRVRRKPNLF